MKETKIVYQTNTYGYFIGEVYAYNGLVPAGSVEVEPLLEEGFIPKWDEDSNSWKQVENHVGEKGFVNNESFEIKEFGPYPEGWTTEYVKDIEEVRAEKYTQAEWLYTNLANSPLIVEGVEFPRVLSYADSIFNFQVLKENNVIPPQAVIQLFKDIDLDVNSKTIIQLINIRKELIAGISDLNTQNKMLMDRIKNAQSIEELEKITINI